MDTLELVSKDKIERYDFGQLIWTNYILGRLKVNEVVELCNKDLEKRFQQTPPFGFITKSDVSNYVNKLSTEIRKKSDEDFQQKITVVVDIVDEVQNIAQQVKEDMEAARERARFLLDASINDASLEKRYFQWDEVLHKDITAFKDLVQLLAGIQGKLQPTITLTLVDEKFKEILAVIRDTQLLPNNLKKQLLVEIRDRIERVRKDLVSLPGETKQVKAKVISVEPLNES